MARAIVGLGGLLSDPACCVMKDGQLAAAVEQAKVSRQDRPGSFPEEAFARAMEAAGAKAEDVGAVALARPFALGPESGIQIDLRTRFPRSEIIVVEHHLAHAASAFYASGMEEAAVLSLDRAGDFRSGALFHGQQNRLLPAREMYFPDSFGDLFNRVKCSGCRRQGHLFIGRCSARFCMPAPVYGRGWIAAISMPII
jgi:carbamoyltransferase